MGSAPVELDGEGGLGGGVGVASGGRGSYPSAGVGGVTPAHEFETTVGQGGHGLALDVLAGGTLGAGEHHEAEGWGGESVWGGHGLVLSGLVLAIVLVLRAEYPAVGVNQELVTGGLAGHQLGGV